MSLISILLPTRNRPLLATLAVEAALAAADADCEVVLADNSDVPLSPLPEDPRLRHLRPQGVLSMPDNWERALAAARGEWVMLLADKYMLVPGAIAALRRMMTTGQSVVTYGYGVLRQSLSAPEEADVTALRRRGGELRWPANAAATRLRDSRQALEELYRSARYPRSYPMLYTATVHRSVTDAAVRRTGRFFHGSCPDVASAVQILAECGAYLETQAPAVMVQYPNADPRWSTGASTLAGGERSRAYFGELVAAGWRGAGIESLVAGAIFETLVACAEARRGARGTPEPSWTEFAKQASREIEGRPLVERPALHARLLFHTQRGRLRPGVAVAQLSAALGVRLPRALARVVLQLQDRTRAGMGLVEEAPAIRTRHADTREGALGFLSSLLASTEGLKEAASGGGR